MKKKCLLIILVITLIAIIPMVVAQDSISLPSNLEGPEYNIILDYEDGEISITEIIDEDYFRESIVYKSIEELEQGLEYYMIEERNKESKTLSKGYFNVYPEIIMILEGENQAAMVNITEYSFALTLPYNTETKEAVIYDSNNEEIDKIEVKLSEVTIPQDIEATEEPKSTTIIITIAVMVMIIIALVVLGYLLMRYKNIKKRK